LPMGNKDQVADYPFDESGGLLDEIESMGGLGDSYDGSDFDESIEEILATEGGVRAHGLDILAFYKSPRFIDERPFKGRWGVFYLNSGVAYINHLLTLEFPTYIPSNNLGLEFLRAHEMFHAKFDVSMLGLELASKKHFYIPQKLAFQNCKCHEPEEALANLAAYKFIKDHKEVGLPYEAEQFFYDFMKRQGGAYSRFDEPISTIQTELASGIFDGHRYRGANSSLLGPWMGFTPSFTFAKRDIPEYFIKNIRYSKLISKARVLPAVRVVTESSKFNKMLHPGHEKFWNNAKNKLIECPARGGLDFKEFPSPEWSIRVNDNFRAHLLPISLNKGMWEAVGYGNHKQMGHG